LDGKVIIGTELDNSGIAGSLKKIKGMFGGLNGTLSQTNKSITAAFSRPLSLAQARVADLERQYERVTAQFNDAKLVGNDAAAQRYGLQQVTLYDRLAAARERLAIEVQAAAQRQAAAETQSASVQESRLAAVFARIRSLAAGVRTSITKAFNGARTVMNGFAKVAGKIKNHFVSLSKSSAKFGTRLRGIVSSALLFNLLAVGLRKVVDYFKQTVGATAEMKSAMASLRGAAESAAAPIIQILTPALAALANMAATVLAYLGQLLTLFTGTVASAAKKATDAAGTAKKAAKSLAGFDEITKLSDPNEGGGGGTSSADKTTPDVTVPDWAQMVVENLKSGEWSKAAQLLTEKINSVFDSADWNGIGDKLAYGIDGALSFLATAILTFNWNGLGTNLATSINTIISKVDWSNLGVVLGAKFIAIIGTLGGVFETIDWAGLGSVLAESLMGLWNAIDWAQAARTLSNGFIGVVTTLSQAIKNIDWQKIGNDVALFIASIDWSGLAASLFDGLGAALGGLTAFLWGLIEGAWNDIVKWWHKTAFDDGEFTMEGLLKGIWEGIKNAGSWLWDQVSGFFGGIVDGICGFLGIQSPSKLMEDLVGKNLALGIGVGFEEEMDAVNKKINNAIHIDDVGINAKIAGTSSATNDASADRSVIVYQTNNYSQAHSRYEIYQSKKQTMAAVQLALAGV
jgi:phage-related protein